MAPTSNVRDTLSRTPEEDSGSLAVLRQRVEGSARCVKECVSTGEARE
jgi:hypothetical protein